MKRITLVVLALALTAALHGCGKGMIHVSAIDPAVRSVSARHDAYVANDAALSPTEREVYLRTTELLRAVLDEAGKP